MAKAQSAGKRALAFLLAVLLACAGLGAFSLRAQADELDDAQAAVDGAQVAVDDAQAVLDSAEASMAQIAGEYDALAAQVDELQIQIDESVAEVMAAQAAMLAGREALAAAAQYEYRSGSASALVTLLLESTNITELLRNLEYLAQIMDYQASEVAAQRERKELFESISEKLSAQKDEQERVLAQLEEKRAEAQQVVSEANERLSGAQDAYSSQLAALQAQAAAFAQAAAEGGAEIAQDANTIDRADVVPAGTPVQPDSSVSDSANGSNADGSAGGGSNAGDAGGGSDTSGGSGGTGAGGESNAGGAESGWLSGVASAYGGSSDPYTPNPGITATGAVCDDSSMGVAVPKSLPNYRSYFGRTVEINYGGMTVYAVVNDCGNMGGGSRVLDLQPGVFKAFGFSDCYAWGLRTVKYRFL